MRVKGVIANIPGNVFLENRSHTDVLIYAAATCLSVKLCMGVCCGSASDCISCPAADTVAAATACTCHCASCLSDTHSQTTDPLSHKRASSVLMNNLDGWTGTKSYCLMGFKKVRGAVQHESQFLLSGFPDFSQTWKPWFNFSAWSTICQIFFSLLFFF